MPRHENESGQAGEKWYRRFSKPGALSNHRIQHPAKGQFGSISAGGVSFVPLREAEVACEESFRKKMKNVSCIDLQQAIFFPPPGPAIILELQHDGAYVN